MQEKSHSSKAGRGKNCFLHCCLGLVAGPTAELEVSRNGSFQPDLLCWLAYQGEIGITPSSPFFSEGWALAQWDDCVQSLNAHAPARANASCRHLPTAIPSVAQGGFKGGTAKQWRYDHAGAPGSFSPSYVRGI